MAAALRAVTTRAGTPDRDVYGTAFLGTTTWYWQMMYLWGNGAEIYDSDETKVIICSPDGVEGLQMLVDLVQRDRVAAPDPESTDATKAAELFYNKRIGILNGSTANIGEVEQAPPGRHHPAPVRGACSCPRPTPRGRSRPPSWPSRASWSSSRSKDPDRTRGAMQLGFHLTDTPAQKEITPIGELPVRKSAGQHLRRRPQPHHRLRRRSRTGARMGRFPENGEIRKLWQNAVQPVWKQEKTPKEALDEMCRLSEPIMAKSQAK